MLSSHGHCIANKFDVTCAAGIAASTIGLYSGHARVIYLDQLLLNCIKRASHACSNLAMSVPIHLFVLGCGYARINKQIIK